jgi:hypothetical protein
MQRTACALSLVLLLISACGGSSVTSNQPVTSSPSPVPSPIPSAASTPNPAKVIFDRSAALMVTIGYTVHRQWLKPQPQTLAPLQWKAGQAPETTVVAIDSPVYSLSSTSDTSPHCPNAICYVVQVVGTQHGSSASCAPAVMIATEVYVDGTSYRNLSRHVVGSGGGGSGCQPVDLEGWDSITFP